MTHRWHSLVAAALALAVWAPAAVAQDLAGSGWASSSAGDLAFVTQDDSSNSTLRMVSSDGLVGAPERITESFDAPTVAIGARGDAIVAWTDRERRLWTRYRPVGGLLGPPELAAPDASSLVEATPLALDAAGSAIVAWAPENGEGGLHVRVRSETGGWGPVQEFGGTSVYRPKLALSDNGSAVIAWVQRGPKGINSAQIAVASRAAGGVFGPAKVVAGVQRNPASPRVATNDRGDAVVAWIELHHRRGDDALFSIHGVFRAPGGSFGRPVALSRTAATAPSVAVGPSGRMTLAWRDNEAHSIEARVRSTTGILGRPHILTRDLMDNGAPTALTAGRGAVTWSDFARGRRVVRVVQATGDRRFAAGRVIARVRGYSLEPAFAVSPLGLSAVVRPPHFPRDPIRWQRVGLSG